MGGVAATVAWWIVWLLKYMKSQVRGTYGKDLPVWKRIVVERERDGLFALYRGVVPGTIRSFFANEIAMISLATSQHKMTDWELR